VRKKSIALVIGVAILIFGAAAYLWVGSSTPKGQDALSTLAPSNFTEFEYSFDKSLEGRRLVLLLSPT
jgi:hypothetical protein